VGESIVQLALVCFGFLPFIGLVVVDVESERGVVKVLQTSDEVLNAGNEADDEVDDEADDDADDEADDEAGDGELGSIFNCHLFCSN
jgi:hypothetical protein